MNSIELASFARSHIGVLLDFDRDHGTDLAGQLERARDAQAARALALDGVSTGPAWTSPVARALELVAANINDPDERLALHLALKAARTAME